MQDALLPSVTSFYTVWRQDQIAGPNPRERLLMTMVMSDTYRVLLPRGGRHCRWKVIHTITDSGYKIKGYFEER
jgi:hypothetical protein